MGGQQPGERGTEVETERKGDREKGRQRYRERHEHMRSGVIHKQMPQTVRGEKASLTINELTVLIGCDRCDRCVEGKRDSARIGTNFETDQSQLLNAVYLSRAPRPNRLGRES